LFKPHHRLIALTLAASCLLTACNQESKEKKGGETGGGETVELWTMQLKPTFETFIGGLIKDWEKQHPGVSVTWVDLPANEIENKTLTAVASGKSPDLVNLNPAFANKLASSDALLAMDLPADFRGRYYDAAWQANTVNGHVVGIPWYLSTSVSFYNQDIWKQAGLKVGDWPRTYQELGADARQIKAKTQALGFMPNFGDRGKFMEVLAQEGVPLLSGDQKHAAFNTPQGAASLKFWVDLFKDGIIPKESVTQGHREAIDRFQAGQTAVFPAGPQFLTIIKQNSPKLYEKLEVGPQITGASGKMNVGVMNLVIPKASQHQDLALNLAEFLTSGKNQLAFAKLVPILPSVKEAAEDPYFKAKPGAPLEDRARALSAEQLKDAKLLVPPMPHQSELSKSLDDALQRSALGQQTPEQALEQAAKEWDSILATP
jgi:putative chitobiose transport system substrate-binding protein